MKMDAKFKELGLQGWNPFKDYFLNIRNLFIKYGEEVLRVDLGESIEIYKQTFIQAGNNEEKFISLLRKMWEERYHYVANDLSQLIYFYEMAQIEGIKFNSLLPNMNNDEGINETFSLSMKLYEDILKMFKNSHEIYIYKENAKFYKVSFYKGFSKTKYRRLDMEVVNFIQVN